MDQIGVFTPEQARALWQDYQERKQLPAQLQKKFPQRRAIDEPSPHRVFVINSDPYEAIPAFACMQITGTDQYAQRTVITVEKPTTLNGEYLFNSPYTIEGGAAGWAYRFGVVVMLGQPPSEANVSYQPIIDSWEIEEGGGPFTVFGKYEITPESTTAALIGRFAGGGSGGGHTIWFTIEEVLCPETDYVAETTLVVTPTWYNRSCTGIPPGAEYGGEYYVYDLCNYLYGLTPSDLVGTTGRASYMYPLTGACEPRWVIDDLCASPVCE
jgi:hypothetical protein